MACVDSTEEKASFTSDEFQVYTVRLSAGDGESRELRVRASSYSMRARADRDLVYDRCFSGSLREGQNGHAGNRSKVLRVDSQHILRRQVALPGDDGSPADCHR